MMAEVVVVSSVVLIVLTTLYISYNKIFSLYETRLTYEDSNLIYALAYYRDYLIETTENGTQNDMTYYLTELSDRYVRLNNTGEFASALSAVNRNDNVYIIKKIEKDENGNYNIPIGNDWSQKLKDYVEYLNKSTPTMNANIMLLERCEADNKNCKYAHLDLEV